MRGQKPEQNKKQNPSLIRKLTPRTTLLAPLKVWSQDRQRQQQLLGVLPEMHILGPHSKPSESKNPPTEAQKSVF